MALNSFFPQTNDWFSQQYGGGGAAPSFIPNYGGAPGGAPTAAAPVVDPAAVAATGVPLPPVRPADLGLPAVAPKPETGGLGGDGTGAGAGGTGLGTGLGWNVGTGQLAIGGLSALGSLWTAWNATDLAKKSFDFNKQLSSDNYTNQSKAYNTNLENIGRSRGVMEHQDPAATQAYIANHSVKTTV